MQLNVITTQIISVFNPSLV